MKYTTIIATLCALVQGSAAAIRTLQKPGAIYERKNEKLRMLMITKPAPAPAPAPGKGLPMSKGKGMYMKMMGKGKGGSMMSMMSSKGKGKGGSMMSMMSSKGKGKGGSMSMMSYKGKGGSMMSMMSYKGKGKGGSMSMMSYKGKGGSMMSMMSSKGKGGSMMSYKGKGGSMSMMSYKGKGGSMMGGSMSGKGKGGSMMSYKGKGGSMMSAKGKGGSMMSAKGKGGSMGMGSGKGKGKGMGGCSSIADIVTGSEEHYLLAHALDEADLLDFFYDPNFEYTVLAPTDKAFQQLAADYPDLYSVIFDYYWIQHLVDILTMHVTEPAVYSDAIEDGMEIEMFNLEVITASTTDGVCFAAEVGEPSCVTAADVAACNGVVHVVDSVIKPFWFEYTVLDIISGIPDLDVLQSLVECSGLDEQLGGYLGMTVFAPINDAFVDADAEYLCSEEGLPTLIDVLTYHVFPFPLPSSLIEVGDYDYETVQGSYATVKYYPDEKMPENTVAMIEDANILDVDYGAINGIVHVIDKIIFPPAPAGKGKGAPSKGKGKGKGSSSMMMMSGKGKGKGSSSMMMMSGKGKGKGY